MELINTDGMALIGPGSEWFWTAVSGIVLAVTFVAIYRQLVLARGMSAREQLESSDREWSSEWFMRCKLEILVSRRDSDDPASIAPAPALAMAGYWERIGALARRGHLDPTLLHTYNGGACPVWWVALAPFIRRYRTELEDETEYQHFEWLAAKMSELDRRNGASVFDERLFATQLAGRIAVFQDRLRFEQDMRAGAIASAPAAPAPSPATVAAAQA